MDTTKRARWGGWTASGIVIAFLIFDSAGKLLRVPAAVTGTEALGYPTDIVLGLGITLLVCLVAYAVPVTSVLGAILLTGYLGGAVATHVRIGNPTFTHVLFPVYVAALAWGGLWLRHPGLRSWLTGRAAARH